MLVYLMLVEMNMIVYFQNYIQSTLFGLGNLDFIGNQKIIITKRQHYKDKILH